MWLQPEKKDSLAPFAERTWDDILKRLAGGEFLVNICKDRKMPEYDSLMAYIHKDPDREEAYYEAKRVAAAGYIDKAMEHSFGGESRDGIPNDIQRDQLIVNSCFRAAGIFNRKRFGDKTQVEVGVTVDISGAINEARSRVERTRTPTLIEGEWVKDD